MEAIINLEAFVLASLLLIVTPGVDTMYILTRSISQGRFSGILSALGVSSGLLVHTLLATFGLSLILQQSSEAFLVVKLTGAFYLIYLGIKSIAKKSVSLTREVPKRSHVHWRIFISGMLTNVLNPKVALFFLAFLPQFIQVNHPDQFMALPILGLLFTAMGSLYCLGLAVFSSSFNHHFQKHPGVIRWLNRISGSIFILIGIRLAFNQRS